MSDVQTTEIDCPYCAEKINAKAKKCRHCSEILDQTMRDIEMLKTQKRDVFVNNNASASSSASSGPAYPRANRSKGVAIFWCVLLGSIGGHRFYLGQTGVGLLYLLFCWTGIPFVISIIELVYLILIGQREFDGKYNR